MPAQRLPGLFLELCQIQVYLDPGTSWDILGHPGTSWDILGHPGTSWDMVWVCLKTGYHAIPAGCNSNHLFQVDKFMTFEMDSFLEKPISWAKIPIGTARQAGTHDFGYGLQVDQRSR